VTRICKTHFFVPVLCCCRISEEAGDEILAVPCCTFNEYGQGRVILTGELW
jgi:hypothetical protein